MIRELKFRRYGLDGFDYFDLMRDDPMTFERFYDTTTAKNYDKVEQYTGLKDKYGKEVYEGDIIKYDGIVYTIAWNEEYMGFDLTRVGNMHLGVPMNVIITCGSVIGNIHEDPELLEDKK